jgi:hypothetical protein
VSLTLSSVSLPAISGSADRRAVAIVAVALLAVFALCFTVRVSPAIPVIVAGAILFAVLLAVNHSWSVHALLLVTFLTLGDGSHTGTRVGGLYVFYYEVALLLAVIYAIWLLRTSPDAVSRLRRSSGARAVLPFGVAVTVGIGTALHSGFPLDDIQSDVRPFMATLMTAFVAAAVCAAGDYRRYIKTVTTILMVSAAVTVYSSVSGGSVGLRTETAQLDATGGGVLEGGSTAIRYLTQTTTLALIVLVGGVALLLLGRISAKQSAPMLVPSVIITFLSFSRNTLLALAGAVLFALLISVIDAQFLRVVMRGIAGAVVVTVGVVVLSTFGHAFGGGAWIDAQTAGYQNRVLAGIMPSNTAVDASALYREKEDMYLGRAGAEHPILGSGFGDRYKPAAGDPGDFQSDRGQMYAHNTYGWLYVKAGPFGLVTFVILIAAALLPALRRSRRDPLLLAAAAALSGLAIAMSVMPMPLDYGDGAVGLGLVIGACIGAGAWNSSTTRLSASSRGARLMTMPPLTLTFEHNTN